MPTSPKELKAARSSAQLADVISFAYAAIVLVAVLHFKIELRVIEAVAVFSIFVLLRWIAHELRSDANRLFLDVERQKAAQKAQHPRFWSVEQRDGYGRRVDAGA